MTTTDLYPLYPDSRQEIQGPVNIIQEYQCNSLQAIFQKPDIIRVCLDGICDAEKNCVIFHPDQRELRYKYEA